MGDREKAEEPNNWISKDHPDAKSTTLLKAVEYETIEPLRYNSGDDKERVNKAIKDMEKNRLFRNADGMMSGMYTDSEIDRISISGCKPGKPAFSAGPVLEVISVCIYKKDKNWEDFGMYGDISLTDYLKNSYYVYNCLEEEPEHVIENKDLYLNTCPVAPAMGPKVKFNLKDFDTHAPIFKDDIDYYLDDSLECGQQVFQDFHGEGDYVARMVFRKHPIAVLVMLEFFIRYKPDDYLPGSTFKVSGTIKANNLICWKSPPEGEELVCGKNWNFDQSRVVFAFPVEKPFEVDIFWSSSDVEFREKIKLATECFFGSTEYPFICENEDYTFKFDLDSACHHDFFHIMCDYMDMKLSSEMPKIYSQLTDKTSLSSSSSLVEVYSILLCNVDSSVVPSPLCGQIVVRDQQGKVYIFARNHDRPDKHSSSLQEFKRTLSLAWPGDKWILEKDFYMLLKLKDDKNNQVCKGYLFSRQWRFDTRLCDVILGENGYYAAVHYSVFLNGKKAKVTVKCSKGSYQYFLVYGSIFAEYDNYDDYRSTYDKECYRVIIFRRSEEDCVKVDRGSEIPLSKSRVSAPSNCQSLSVHVDLWVRPLCNGRAYEPAVDKLVFEAGKDKFRRCGKNVIVRIQWFKD